MSASGLFSVLYFVAFGLLFYWMMKKGGCGMHGHGSHAHQPGHGAHDPGEGGSRRLEVDPVCGMKLDRTRAAGTRTIGRTTFYLCSDSCLAQFDRDAARLTRHATGGG